MATTRKTPLVTGEIYHVFNRGVEKRPIFTQKREFERAKELLWYCNHDNPQIRYSFFKKLPKDARERQTRLLEQQNRKTSIISYALMPNHFHLLLKQERDRGITEFLSELCNSYAKYFNTKHTRVGPLFQGEFKAVRIENAEQLMHVSRYIHLNPVVSYLISENELTSYPWTSLHEYTLKTYQRIVTTSLLLANFRSLGTYIAFIHDQAAYAQTLASIKHLTLEEQV